jgi:hypothetical protein
MTQGMCVHVCLPLLGSCLVSLTTLLSQVLSTFHTLHVPATPPPQLPQPACLDCNSNCGTVMGSPHVHCTPQRTDVDVGIQYFAISASWTLTAPVRAVSELRLVLHHVTCVNHLNKSHCYHQQQPPLMHQCCDTQHLRGRITGKMVDISIDTRV